MTDRPIIFSAPMIRALLDGRKTMTRRLAALPPKRIRGRMMTGCVSPWTRVKVGDRLWVRETLERANGEAVGYPADGTWLPNTPWEWRNKKLPSIHMPRWASRLTLIVTATKIEKLLDITEEDARAEGFAGGKIDDGFGARNFGDGWTVKSLGVFASATGMFQLAWKGLHPKWDGFSSPEVVALTFRIVRANIDSAEARAA